MYNIIVMDDLDTTSFDFSNISYPKLPASIRAKYCFDDEQFLIPLTEVYLSVDAGCWIIFDGENDNIFTMTMDQFIDVYIASDKRAQRYLEFVLDSNNNEYTPSLFESKLNLFEEIFGDLIEKPVPIVNKWKLVWDLIIGKSIYLSKYI